jgi:hypothetical protein
VSIRLGDGTGRVTSPSTPEIPLDSYSIPTSVAVGDFNNDGKLDFAVTTLWSNVFIRLGDGRGGFTSPGTPAVLVGGLTWSVAVDDFNNDGKLDLVTANASLALDPMPVS